MLRMKTISLDMFFDSDMVKRAVDKTTCKVLSKAGAFVHTAARSSVRKRKAISAPGLGAPWATANSHAAQARGKRIPPQESPGGAIEGLSRPAGAPNQ